MLPNLSRVDTANQLLGPHGSKPTLRTTTQGLCSETKRLSGRDDGERTETDRESPATMESACGEKPHLNTPPCFVAEASVAPHTRPNKF